MKDVQATTWLLLITNLPGRNPTLRMRLWRALKATGAGPLRDGVYVLPISELSRRAFEEQATEIKGAGGTAHIVPFEAESPQQQAAFIALFDRTAGYQEVNRNLETLKNSFAKLGIPTAEDPGFAAVMAGARDLQPDDDAVLEAMTPVIDSLYKAYSSTPHA